MKTKKLLLMTGILLSGFLFAAGDGEKPWAVEKFGAKLLTSAGREVDTKQALEGKTVCVYFSASWCGPCRAFTPQLVKFHRQAAKKNNIEIVFASCDKSSQAMFDYMKKDNMPWYALPFGGEESAALKKELQVSGIPTLAVFAPDGRLVTRSGRTDVAILGVKAAARWKSSNYKPATAKDAQKNKKSSKKSKGKTSKKK